MFLKGQRVKDFISLAGGLENSAEKSEIYIKYPDGDL